MALNDSNNNQGNLNSMARTATIHSVDTMNNQALEYLFEGNYEEATRVLIQCLQQASFASLVDQDEELPSPSQFSKRLVPTSLDCVLAADEWSSSDLRNMACCFLPYRVAFALNHCQDELNDDDDDMRDYEDDSSSEQLPMEQLFYLLGENQNNHHELDFDATTAPIITTTLVLAMVTFNLAMMCHELGMVEGNLPQIAVARSLYQRAAATISTSRDGCGNESSNGSNNSNDLLLFKLALSNNLGHVDAILGDYYGILQCRDEMQRLLKMAGTSGSHHNNSSSSSSTTTRTPCFTDSTAEALFRESLARAYNVNPFPPPPPAA